MLLAIDTAGRQGGIALAAYDGPFAILQGESELAGGTFSADLVPEIAALLAANERNLRDLSAIAVITGPGSFTGLRIGLAAVKGLCEVLPVPVVPVTMLELLAAATAAEKVTALLDASRKEVFLGEFRVRDGLAHAEREELLRVSEVQLEGLTITPDTAIAHATGAIEVPRPRAGDLATYAVRKLASGLISHADQLDAHYIRRSDAELYSKPVFGA
jgi:tRNA threonylcarbamoyladenosine biosynthesis protein TsaB